MTPATNAPVVTVTSHRPAFALWYEGLPPLQRAAATLLAFGSLMVAITAIGHWAARGPLSD